MCLKDNNKDDDVVFLVTTHHITLLLTIMMLWRYILGRGDSDDIFQAQGVVFFETKTTAGYFPREAIRFFVVTSVIVLVGCRIIATT